ncbi:MAG TPA: nitroreductase family protein [Acidimicrobiia bacterium]|nr:nitroreductase family protein [Acidimicrobiia bacterium]
MEFQDVVRRRRMVRSFEPEPVPRDTLERILENALHAPSAGFTQGYAFLVLEGAEETVRFWDATFPDPAQRARFRYPRLFDAPVIVVPLSSENAYVERYAEPDKGVTDRRASFWPVPYWHIDAGFATMLMLLTAVDTGLGALFFGIFPEHLDAFRAAFAVPDDMTPIGAVALGVPARDDPPSPSLRRGRKPLEAVVHRGMWGRT